MQKEYRACPVMPILSVTALYTFSHRRFEAGYSFAGESHAFPEAVLVTEGRAGITAGSDVFILSRGDMILHPAQEFHKLWSDGSPFSVVVVSFGTREDFLPKTRVLSLGDAGVERLLSIYGDASRAFDLDTVHVAGVAKGKEVEAAEAVKRLEQFLLPFAAGGDDKSPVYSGRGASNFKAVLRVMEAHLSEKLSVERLATLAHMSVPTMEKTVHRFTGYGASAYYNILRMREADRYLAAGHTVKEAAAAIGFKSQNYFSAAYKKWAGHPPSEKGILS